MEGCHDRRRQEKHEEDEVYQEEVNWLKYTPPHDIGDDHYKEGFSTMRQQKKELLMKIILLKYGLEAGYLLSSLMKLPNIQVQVPPGKPNDEVAPKTLQVAAVPIKYQQGEKPLCFKKSHDLCIVLH